MNTLSNIYTIEQLKRYNSEHERYFFSPDTMRFFKSRVAPGVIHAPEGIVFITSEQFDYNSPRLYSVRIMRESGEVDHFAGSEFQQFPNLRSARNFARTESDKLNSMWTGE